MAATVSVLPEISEEELTEFRMMLGGRGAASGRPRLRAGTPVVQRDVRRRPGLVVLCKGTADVVAAVDFARERGIEVTVRGGGHSVAGLSSTDGGMVIDLAPMNGVLVDKNEKLAYVQGGALWADVDREGQLYGLSTPGGVVSDTGVAGLTLGGGYGWLRRTYGLSCDNVVAYEVVTADGRVLNASADENPDLYWALRGGGGNFGIVTRFTFRLHPVGPIVAFAGVFYRSEDAETVLRGFREYAETAPDEVNCMAVAISFPEDEHLPPPVHNQKCFVVGVGLRRRSREGHGGHPAASRAGDSAGRHLAADAVADRAGGVRRLLPAPGGADVLEVDLGDGASGRAHRPDRDARPGPPGPARDHRRLADRWSGEPRRPRRGRVQRALGQVPVQRRGDLARRGRRRQGRPLGARHVERDLRVRHRHDLHQLRRGGRVRRRRGLRRQAREAGADQGQVRPGELLPPQQQHRARLRSG